MELDSQTTSRASHWGITINNPSEDDRRSLRTTQRWLRRVRGQDEIGENGTLHVQAYANTDQVRLSQLKSWLPRAHFVPLTSKAHIDNMISYVHKDDPTAVADTRFDITMRTTANKPLTMAGTLTMLAEYAWTASEIKTYIDRAAENGESTKLKDVHEKEFWHIVNLLLSREPDLVALLTQPQYLRAWLNTRQTWITKFRLDSQTNIEVFDSPPDSPISLPANILPNSIDDGKGQRQAHGEEGC